MNRNLLIAAAALGLLMAPMASAQQSTTVTLVAEPVRETLSAGGSAIINGTLTVSMDATALANVNGVPVTYAVTKVPTWLTVTIQPSSDVLYASPTLAASHVVSKTFSVQLDVPSNATDDALGHVEITAVVTPGAPAARGASAKMTFPVKMQVVASEKECDEHAASAMITPPAQSQNAPDNTLSVQTGGPVVGPKSYAAVGGFAAAGAGVGLLLRRRA